MAALRSLTWWVGIGLIVLAVYAVVEAAEWSRGGRLFPWFAGAVLIGGVGLHSLLGLLNGVRAEIEPETSGGKPVALAWRAQVLGWITLILVLVPLIGQQLSRRPCEFGKRLPLWVNGIRRCMGRVSQEGKVRMGLAGSAGSGPITVVATVNYLVSTEVIVWSDCST